MWKKVIPLLIFITIVIYSQYTINNYNNFVNDYDMAVGYYDLTRMYFLDKMINSRSYTEYKKLVDEQEKINKSNYMLTVYKKYDNIYLINKLITKDKVKKLKPIKDLLEK